MTDLREVLPPTLPPDRRQLDPFAVGMTSLIAIVISGFTTIVLGYRSVAHTVIEAAQLPGLLSGTVAGLALVAVGCGLAVVFHGRRSEAVLRAETERLLAASTAVLQALDSASPR